MALTKPPKLNQVQPPTGGVPPASRTQDNYSHHTSPTPGNAQAEASTELPRRTMRTMPDTPMHVTKHSNPVGRPRKRNDG